MYGAIVIGVGGMGSATVYHLAHAGCRVLGLEFCSVVGRVMAELCLGRSPSWDIGRFRLTPERAAAEA